METRFKFKKAGEVYIVLKSYKPTLLKNQFIKLLIIFVKLKYNYTLHKIPFFLNTQKYISLIKVRHTLNPD